ncbi:hypothetical protein LR48_Vigan06g145600 [Vigna angularis]|uniref:Uncharacterized protein n=1 Tax=Phaseolus angularis TaxID=3914 RepID=A0A0L9UTF0_PHAAN|nr:hypothetical protein LR48_Vigan06g145600 [Vigna angularis]
MTTPAAGATTVHGTRSISSFLSSRSLFLTAGQEHCRRQRQCWKRRRPLRPSSFRALSFTRGTETQLRRDIIAVARHSAVVGTSAATGARCDATSSKEQPPTPPMGDAPSPSTPLLLPRSLFHAWDRDSTTTRHHRRCSPLRCCRHLRCYRIAGDERMSLGDESGRRR